MYLDTTYQAHKNHNKTYDSKQSRTCAGDFSASHLRAGCYTSVVQQQSRDEECPYRDKPEHWSQGEKNHTLAFLKKNIGCGVLQLIFWLCKLLQLEISATNLAAAFTVLNRSY